jgi:dolichol-phosphate mannosyltransferase
MPSTPKVSAIVPVLYEEPQLRQTLGALAALRDRCDLELVVVVDIPDPAREAAARSANDSVASETGAVVVYRVGERGFGSAVRRGFAEASGDVVIPVMADVCDRLEDIPELAARVQDGWDVVAGSRYARGGAIVGNTLKQRLSHVYSILMRLAGGPPIHDISNAFKAYRRSAVEAISSEAESFDVSVELTVKAHLAGLRVGEIPTVWTNRKMGSSKFKIGRELRNYGRWLGLALRSRFRSRERRLARSEEGRG